jgi:hypothetical protein
MVGKIAVVKAVDGELSELPSQAKLVEQAL